MFPDTEGLTGVCLDLVNAGVAGVQDTNGHWGFGLSTPKCISLPLHFYTHSDMCHTQ